jgi:hypothetical protein
LKDREGSDHGLIRITIPTYLPGLKEPQKASVGIDSVLAGVQTRNSRLQAVWSNFLDKAQHLQNNQNYSLLASCISGFRNVMPFMFLLFSNQLVNPATSSTADDVHQYVIPPKLLLTNRFYFQQTSGIHGPVGKRKGSSLSGRSPAPIADISNVATSVRKHSVLNLREINRNNMHTALASVLTYYGWVSLIF